MLNSSETFHLPEFGSVASCHAWGGRFSCFSVFSPRHPGPGFKSVGSKVPTGFNSKCETEVFQWDRGSGLPYCRAARRRGCGAGFSACAGKIRHGDSGGVNGHRKKNDGKDSRGPRNACAVAGLGLAHRGGQWDNRRGSCGPALLWRGLLSANQRQGAAARCRQGR